MIIIHVRMTRVMGRDIVRAVLFFDYYFSVSNDFIVII